MTPAVDPACRAAVLVHGGGYFFGDAGSLEVSWAEPLRRAGLRVWNVEYPMLPDMPDVVYDPAEPWYPRPDVGSTPPALRVVHDRATDAVAPAVAEALATGCRVTLVGVSAGGSIVADLAHRFPQVHEAVLVAGASITPDRVGGAALRVFYGALDEVVLPAASLETCERWTAAGSVCGAVGLAGEPHVAPALTEAALAHVLAAA
jgi:acetyl esterase/lipase